VTIALVGKYIDLPDAYLSVTEALRAGGFATAAGCRSAGCPPTTARPPRGAAHALGGVDGVCIPAGSASAASRASSARIRYAAGPTASRRWAVPGPAVHGHRVRPQRRRAARGQLRRVRPRTPPTRSSPPWPTRSTSSPASATWAAPCGWAATRRAAAGSVVAAATARPRSPSGTAPLRGRQRLPRPARTWRAGLLRHLARRSAGRVRRAAARRAPFFVGTQAHPELKSRPTRPHPLFARVRRAAIDPSPPARLPSTRREGRHLMPSRPPTIPVLPARRSTRAGGSRGGHRGHARGRGQRPRGRAPPGRGRRRRSTTRTGRPGPQYRHPVGGYLWELPAGLRDADGEPPLAPRSASWPRRRCCRPRAGRC
jgi:CTP synthase